MSTSSLSGNQGDFSIERYMRWLDIAVGAPTGADTGKVVALLRNAGVPVADADAIAKGILNLRAATLLGSSHGVYGVTHLASIARLLPERDPHEDIFGLLEHSLDDFDDIGSAAVHLIHFELAMLSELGFGLALENCAVTGETTDLIYVSPKSGGAVSRGAGEPWRDRLLRLPPFLRQGEMHDDLTDEDLQDGFRLTGLFLLRHVLEPRGQVHSDARAGFINALTRQQAKAALPAP